MCILHFRLFYFFHEKVHFFKVWTGEPLTIFMFGKFYKKLVFGRTPPPLVGTKYQLYPKINYSERPLGRYYRPQYRPPSKSPSDYCTYKITRLLDSIELAKNFIEEARTVEKIKIR